MSRHHRDSPSPHALCVPLKVLLSLLPPFGTATIGAVHSSPHHPRACCDSGRPAKLSDRASQLAAHGGGCGTRLGGGGGSGPCPASPPELSDLDTCGSRAVQPDRRLGCDAPINFCLRPTRCRRAASWPAASAQEALQAPPVAHQRVAGRRSRIYKRLQGRPLPPKSRRVHPDQPSRDACLHPPDRGPDGLRRARQVRTRSDRRAGQLAWGKKGGGTRRP